MSIPGANILSMALTAIARQSFQYYSFADRTVQPNGQYLATYNAPVILTGSAQPLTHELVREYGLDFERNYYNFYVSQSLIDLQRDVSGDQIQFACNTYQCLKVTPWFGIDGWVAVLCVQVSNA